jgi:hypothetical protein
MWSRILSAIDQYDSGLTALEFTIGVARAVGIEGAACPGGIAAVHRTYPGSTR